MASLVKKQAFGYVRVSTELQASEGVSLEAQRERIKRWCEADGYELADLFVDAGISGSRSHNRPGLQKALTAVCEAGGALIVYSLSRLARSTIDAITISQRLDRAGADLVSLTEKIDTTSAAGKMIFRLLAVLAEFERDVISERTSTALHQLRRNGKRISGRIPFGQDLAEDGKTLVPNAVEQLARNRIISRRAEGMSLRAIAQSLNNDGVKTKGGKPWVASSIQSILSSAGKSLK
jgi:DNA invertase Pin-like site-specific DNA recombinase